MVNWRDLSNPEAGGAEVHLHEIFGRLARSGHQVTLVCHAFGGAPAAEVVDDIHVQRMGTKFDFNWRAHTYCRRLMRHQRFDVVIENLNKLPFHLAPGAPIPAVAILHHFFGDSIWRETNPVAASYVRLGEWWVKRRYRRVPMCVVSQSTADELVAAGFARRAVRIIHNAVDHHIYTPDASTLPVPGRIVYLGRVKRYKGIDTLIRALPEVRRAVPAAHLWIMGGGDDRRRLETLGKRLGLGDTVQFFGRVDEATKIRGLHSAMVMANPSPKEGWGVTTIEANACGTPVVAADVPGLRDAVVDNQTGLLVPFADRSGWVAALTSVLADDQRRRRLAAGALEWAARFSWDSSARQMEAWLDEVTTGRERVDSAPQTRYPRGQHTP